VLTIGGNTTIALGSIVLTNNTDIAKIIFATAGAKITALADATTKATATIGGDIVANSGSVGGKLEVYSTAENGLGLKLGYIVLAANATFDGTDNVISGPNTSGATTISSETTVTGST
jgi:hypothetical protein